SSVHRVAVGVSASAGGRLSGWRCQPPPRRRKAVPQPQLTISACPDMERPESIRRGRPTLASHATLVFPTSLAPMPGFPARPPVVQRLHVETVEEIHFPLPQLAQLVPPRTVAVSLRETRFHRQKRAGTRP